MSLFTGFAFLLVIRHFYELFLVNVPYLKLNHRAHRGLEIQHLTRQDQASNLTKSDRMACT